MQHISKSRVPNRCACQLMTQRMSSNMLHNFGVIVSTVQLCTSREVIGKLVFSLGL